MARIILSDQDHLNVARILNLPASNSNGQPVVHEQLTAAITGLAWKDSVRVATTTNIVLTPTPPSAIDGVGLAANDRVLVKNQTNSAENGIYVWTSTSAPMTRSPDAATALDLEQAVVSVEEGTSADSSFRQTEVNFTLGSGAVVWGAFGTQSPSASETTAGIAEIATQSETDSGTDDQRIVTPLKLKTSPHVARRAAFNVGDNSATQFTLNHNLGTFDVTVEVYRTSGSRDTVLCDVDRPSTSSVRLTFASAPAAAAFRAVVVA